MEDAVSPEVSVFTFVVSSVFFFDSRLEFKAISVFVCSTFFVLEQLVKTIQNNIIITEAHRLKNDISDFLSMFFISDYIMT